MDYFRWKCLGTHLVLIATQYAIGIGTGLWRIVGHGETGGGHDYCLLRWTLRGLSQRSVVWVGRRILLERINAAEAAIHQIRITRHMSSTNYGLLVHLNSLRRGASLRHIGIIGICLHLQSVEIKKIYLEK